MSEAGIHSPPTVPRFPPFSGLGTASREYGAALADDDLPPIEQFLDELPSIDDFGLDTGAIANSVVYDAEPDSRPVNKPEYASELLEEDAEGWAISKWQSYDWQGVATLLRMRR